MKFKTTMHSRIIEDIYQNLINKTKLLEIFPTLETFLNNLHDYPEQLLSRVKQFGTTEKGEPLVIRNWSEELLLTVGDLRIHHALTCGNAQCGKSLFNTLLLVDFLIFTRLNALWFYPSKSQVDTLVPELFGNIVRRYLENVENYYGISLTLPTDRRLASRYQVNGATAIFSYASNSAKDNSPTKQGLATVGTAASAISASILFIDERSQIDPQAIAILPRRLDAGRIPTQPIREVGTFGSGLGIENVLKKATHHFYPHIICENCGETIQLSPKGCLLKKDAKGKYLGKTGRPFSWFYKDVKDKVNSAYFACPSCEHEITSINRFISFFQCLRTGVKLRDYLKTVGTDYLNKREIIALHLSPLLRESHTNLAAKLISIGLNTESTKDYQQQVLGFSSESDDTRVTDELINKAKKQNKLETWDYVIAGIDQGRSEHYLTICRYQICTDKSLTWLQRWELSKREIIVNKPVYYDDIPGVLQQYNVNFGFIDNEPDRAQALQLQQTTCLTPADQRKNPVKIQATVEVSTGGIPLEAVAFDNDFFHDAVLNSFLLEVITVPETWDVNDDSTLSPTRHFKAPYKDEDNLWQRPRDRIDDLFYSYVFCEAAFYYKFKEYADEKYSNIDWYEYL